MLILTTARSNRNGLADDPDCHIAASMPESGLPKYVYTHGARNVRPAKPAANALESGVRSAPVNPTSRLSDCHYRGKPNGKTFFFFFS